MAGAALYPAITNLQQLHDLVSRERRIVCDLDLEGLVCAVSPSHGLLTVQDETSTQLLQVETDLADVTIGSRVVLRGLRCEATRGSLGIGVGRRPVVNNDGTHPMREASGAAQLEAGRQPLCLAWFNSGGSYGLQVEYDGPGIARQRIPNAALFQPEAMANLPAKEGENGIAYRSYEGTWALLPDFSRLPVVRAGTATNFDLQVAGRENYVGVEFRGSLQIPREGRYTFYVTSDDGCKLWVGRLQPRIEVRSRAVRPVPQIVRVGGILPASQGCLWATLAGTVSFVSEHPDHLELELKEGTSRLRVAVADAADLTPARLLGSRVRVTGVCHSDDGTESGTTPGSLSVVSARDVEVLAASPHPVSGRADGLDLATGAGATNRLPVLNTVESIQGLTREQAERGYPVKIRGVITCADSRLYNGLVLQDATRGVYVTYPAETGPANLRLGEVWEIEGVTGPGDFAPLVQARTMTCVGEGRLPEPVHPTWPQLMNGSLDTQFVELRGMVTGVEADALTLLTHWGRLRVMTTGLSPQSLASCENTLVRIRGCLLAVWDAATHRVKVGEIVIGSAAINVDRAEPADSFAVPSRRVADLLLFDLKAGEFQRVKVAGQVISRRNGEHFVMDSTHGLRVLARQAEAFAPGDLVEVAGFPELGGPSPVLREAVVRRVGRAALPPPQRLSPDNLLRADCDATRVQVDGLLLNLRTSRGEQFLELKSGPRMFVARLKTGLAAPPAAGSLLELTGAYVAQGGEPAIGKGIDSFELLLDSPADIRVLARPGWWTIGRLLVALGVLAVVLCGAMLWAFLLKRQVMAQTQVIREQVEREATLEERGRIARELHDSLEQALAGLSLQLNALAGRLPELAPEARRILETARLMVRHGQEEARRTVCNLRLLALEKADLQTALAQMAEEAGRDTPVKIQISVSGTPRPLAPKVESHLLRIAQEATTNALKHAGAANIALELHYDDGQVRLSVRDDGCGFDAAHAHSSKAGHFGLLGMRERAEKLRGGLDILSSPGAGTTIQVTVALHSPAPGVEFAA